MRLAIRLTAKTLHGPLPKLCPKAVGLSFLTIDGNEPRHGDACKSADEGGGELPTLQAIKQFVAMGNGVALLPEISVEGDVARGDLVRVPVRELQLHRKLRLVYRKGGKLSHAAQAFLKVAESIASQRGRPYCFQPGR